jgi:hypothetical protein
VPADDAHERAPTPTLRPVAPGLEARLGHRIDVLDHGFIRVIDYMGDDAAVVQAARVSYGKGTKAVREDRGLIRYLMRHRHTTPFEMCELKLHVKLPIFVARQWIRHRMASVNEASARYSVLDREFYLPRPEDLATQSRDNKQGRGEALSAEAAAEVLRLLEDDALRVHLRGAPPWASTLTSSLTPAAPKRASPGPSWGFPKGGFARWRAALPCAARSLRAAPLGGGSKGPRGPLGRGPGGRRPPASTEAATAPNPRKGRPKRQNAAKPAAAPSRKSRGRWRKSARPRPADRSGPRSGRRAATKPAREAIPGALRARSADRPRGRARRGAAGAQPGRRTAKISAARPRSARRRARPRRRCPPPRS